MVAISKFQNSINCDSQVHIMMLMSCLNYVLQLSKFVFWPLLTFYYMSPRDRNVHCTLKEKDCT